MPEVFRDPRPKDEPLPLPWSRPGVLVGVDGSEASLEALRAAADIAPRLDLPLHVLVVWDYPTMLYGDQYHPVIEPHPEETARQILDETLAAAFGESIPTWCTSGTERGRTARTLIERSREAAIVALGSRGHGGFAGLLLGSVSAACVAHAHCPVLIWR
jgi:nucleotide-binding universal stress UspA family protein